MEDDKKEQSQPLAEDVQINVSPTTEAALPAVSDVEVRQEPDTQAPVPNQATAATRVHTDKYQIELDKLNEWEANFRSLDVVYQAIKAETGQTDDNFLKFKV